MLRKLTILFLSFFTVAVVYGQSVGLVLSGGGAKGLYHIGVLQALEENEIAIDYVAGTSMGSIIAGLYAAGYTPEQMRAIAVSGDLEQWISGRLDKRHYRYYREQDNPPTLLTLRFNVSRDTVKYNRGALPEGGVNHQPTMQLPTDFITSTPIDLALNEKFRPASVACGGDFSKLMVPFFCVAADMNARKPVVFRSGDLCLFHLSSSLLERRICCFMMAVCSIISRGSIWLMITTRTILSALSVRLVIAR